METILNATKRKKRKTRKCLNEIRKKSRNTGQMLFQKDDNKLDIMHSKNITKGMITNNRLTLRMFPNAIQSKTITRPALLAANRKADIKMEELVMGANIVNLPNPTRNKIPLKDIINGNPSFKNNDLNNFTLHKLATSKESFVRNTEESKENSDLFSSMDEFIKSPIGSIDSQSVSTIMSTSTRSQYEDNGYALYEEFMSDIPACLQENTKLLQGDVMKKTKMLLLNLFKESCYDECENNMLKCIKMKKDSPQNKFRTTCEVVHNPMDYIRLGYVQHQNQYHETRRLKPHTSSNNSSCSSLRSVSSLTTPSDASLSVVMQDMPDYTYYPHRLN